MTFKNYFFTDCVKCVVIRWRVSLLIIFIASFCSAYLHYWNIDRLIQYEKCPVCYGDTHCHKFLNHSLVSIYYLGYFGWILNSISTKNVYRGLLDSKEVVVKRLGHESELEELGDILCKKAPGLCDKEIPLPENIEEFVLSDIKRLLSNRLETEYNVNLLRFCPSFQNMPSIFKNVNCRNYRENKWPLPRLFNLWTVLYINPEPIILQVFPQKEGWPFPEYLGACGRIIIESYEGNSLLHFYKEPWEKRARLALQLLTAVDQFVLQSPDLALYLLDFSVDNIVVDANGSVSFVDLEHTIIVDKHSHSSDKGRDWNTIHYSGGFCISSDDCSYYSPEDVCEHRISDFNHYMLCKDILAPSKDPYATMPQGLLYSTPSSILIKYPSFLSALKTCSSDLKLDHMSSAHILRDILQAEVG